MNILAVNVSLLRKRTGLSTNQLAKRLGVGNTTVNNLETGYLTSPSEKLLCDLAIVFDTTVDGLLGRAPLDVAERARMVYVVDSVSATSTLVEYDKIIGSVFIDRDKLRGYEYFGLLTKDNSMANRRILAGDIVIVRCDCPLKNNDIVAVLKKAGGETILRSYFKKGKKIILKAESDSYLYKDIILEDGDNRFKVIGKVVKCEFEL